MNRIVEQPCRMDLHIHSAASTTTRDKGNKPLEACTAANLPVLVKRLSDNGINVCAITDHDTFDFELYKEFKAYEGADGLELVLPGGRVHRGVRGSGRVWNRYTRRRRFR